MSEQVANYSEEHIRSLDWKEHIRLRPGMYIGKLGDGSSFDDGIYVLLKEVIDNCIDEHMMGFGKRIVIDLDEDRATIRDYGRGIPQGKLVDCVAKINTGGKYDSKAFQKSVGLNGVGTKAVNALSDHFKVTSYRDGKGKTATFRHGNLTEETELFATKEKSGTWVEFVPDPAIFKNYKYRSEFVEEQLKNYAFLNAGLAMVLNGQEFVSKNGLKDLLENKTDPEAIRYPIIHLKGEDIEMALTHGSQYGEDYYSFVNGQYTTQGGTHLAAFREAVVNTVREFYNKKFDTSDVRASIIGAVAVRVQEPVFESQTKTKLGSTHANAEGPTIRTWVNDFVKTELDNYLHQHPQTAEALLKRILQSEKERKDIAGIKKLANERAKKANLHNKKLRDCRIHYTDGKKEGHEETTIFITEGDSASGSITKARDPNLQAVFSLRGKPLNCYNQTKKVVYQNEEFNLLQHALDIEDGLENLRFNKVVIATDADVDGMHIRLLLLTFFLQFFPDLVKKGHLFILETPLFRVRDKKKTFYCYSEKEKQKAIAALRGKAEITRFKGLGEISPNEFKDFISENIRLEPVVLKNDAQIPELLEYYMGKNTMDRQNHIIDNLRVEKDKVEGEAAQAEKEEAA